MFTSCKKRSKKYNKLKNLRAEFKIKSNNLSRRGAIRGSYPISLSL